MVPWGVMKTSSSPQVTQLLLAWRQGDGAALDQLVPVVYQELRRPAHHYMAGQLINEVSMRLVDCQLVNWQNRAHFIAVSGTGGSPKSGCKTK